MQIDIRFPGAEEFGKELLAKLERIAIALETGPARTPFKVNVKFGPPVQEDPKPTT